MKAEQPDVQRAVIGPLSMAATTPAPAPGAAASALSVETSPASGVGAAMHSRPKSPYCIERAPCSPLAGATVPVDDSYVFPLMGTIARVLAAVAFLVGFALVAPEFTRAGKSSHRQLARVGLMVCGAGSGVGMLLIALAAGAAVVQSVGSGLIQLVTVVAIAYAGYAALRFQAFGRWRRLALAALAVVELLRFVLLLIPAEFALTLAVALYATVAILLVVFGLVAAVGTRNHTTSDGANRARTPERVRQG